MRSSWDADDDGDFVWFDVFAHVRDACTNGSVPTSPRSSANDEEESLFSKLTSESLIEARSKFGSKETEGSRKRDKRRDKKRRSRRRVDGGSPSSRRTHARAREVQRVAASRWTGDDRTDRRGARGGGR